MNADEMFEELGFEKQELNDKLTGTILMYNKKTELKLTRRISFFKNRKIACSENYLYAAKISMQELQAINEKVKELRLGKQLNKEIKSIKEK